jgi:hypothetical protein
MDPPVKLKSPFPCKVGPAGQGNAYLHPTVGCNMLCKGGRPVYGL